MARRTATSEHRVRCKTRHAGFTYLGILMAIALLGIALAAIGQMWSTERQRTREQELLWAGGQIRAAISRYYRSAPLGEHQYPQDLEDLVLDKRGSGATRHLRRVYADPMTGSADWERIRSPDGFLLGVASRSTARPIKRARFSAENAYFESSDCYCDWRFVYLPQLLPDNGVALATGLAP